MSDRPFWSYRLCESWLYMRSLGRLFDHLLETSRQAEGGIGRGERVP